MRALANKLKTLVGNIKGKFSGELGKIARMGNIAGKSPLEVPDTGPTSHMKEDPFQYGFVHYPAHIGQIDEGHYMIFLVVENNKTAITDTGRQYGFVNSAAGTDEIGFDNTNPHQTKKFKTRMQGIKSGGMKNIMKERAQMSGMENKFAKSNYTVSKAIFLYTPPAISANQSVEYANIETGALGGFLKALLGGEGGSFLDKIKNLDISEFKGVGQAMLRGALEAVGGDAIRVAQQKGSGMAKNPQLELAFESVPFRTFEYQYTFAPKNRKELDNVHKIIQLFRFHMLPELALGNTGSEAMYNLPSQFEIRYMYKEKENVYIPKISKCALNSCDINYTPHERFTTFKGDSKGASPNIMTMTLSFTEMEVMTKNTVAMGY